jgi:hypothetical protein
MEAKQNVVRSVSRLVRENAATFESVLSLHKGVTHPMVAYFLRVSEDYWAKHGSTAVPEEAGGAKADPLVKGHATGAEVSCGAGRSSKDGQSSEGGGCKGKANGAVSTLSLEEVVLAEDVAVRRGDNLISSVVGGGDGLEVVAVVLVDTLNASETHIN